MKIAYINPNSTVEMTDNIVAVARSALPVAEIIGYTNPNGPPAIQGAADGEAAFPGLMAMLPQVQADGADAIVIACFDDTGLEAAREAADCPVLGIGQSAYFMSALLGRRFSVVTSLPISIPILEANVGAQGFGASCASVRASGLPVLEIDRGGEAVLSRMAEEISLARDEDGATAVVLGCAGMAPLRHELQRQTGMMLIDGVHASALLAQAAAANFR